jgi:pimeloyl-ACP methyl ester carboxylesterase
LEPVSHYYFSHRLKLQFWDWGQDGKPALLLVHGGLDHARNWDWVARSLREHFHVYAMDLRGHGNSAWAPGASYSIPEHVLDIATLVDLLSSAVPGRGPLHLIGHSLGGVLTLVYAGLYPDRVGKVIAIEGLGFPASHRIHKPAPERLRAWIEDVRKIGEVHKGERPEPRSYSNLAAAAERMKEANPHLSDEVARHLTLHGTNWNADGSLSWKFDNYVRSLPPFGHSIDDLRAIFSRIASPVLLFWGLESWLPDPGADDRILALRNHRLVKVPGAGHWVHHDRLDLFLEESTRFLLEP